MSLSQNTKVSKFWNRFYEKPLDEIPWQNTQADWFKELVDGGGIKGKSAIDLGCGTGKKSIYLAKKKFEKVIGVDISHKAIEIAKQNAIEEGVKDNCSFFCHDVTDLSFININQTFDFVLDWACFHCIPQNKLSDYAQSITNHSHKNSYFLLRTFTTTGKKTSFETESDGETQKIYLYNRSQIVKLFPEYKIVKQNHSKPRTKTEYGFLELLMVKR